MTARERILTGAYATLVMANQKTIEEVPVSLREFVEIEIASREILALS